MVSGRFSGRPDVACDLQGFTAPNLQRHLTLRGLARSGRWSLSQKKRGRECGGEIGVRPGGSVRLQSASPLRYTRRVLLDAQVETFSVLARIPLA